MRFTISLLALLFVFQAVIALPTAVLDTPSTLSARSNDQVVGTSASKDQVREKCFGLGFNGFAGNIWGGAFPFSQPLWNNLMGQFGFGGLCSPFMGSGFGWGSCLIIAQCPGAFNTFQNVFIPGFRTLGLGGGFGWGNSIWGLNDKEMKSDTNTV
ncbi:secreted protein [Melampsora americana]|nr:secreted protein [Melampsora americana]